MAERQDVEFQTYMLVVAHPDDAEFSSAGTVAKLTRDGKRVVVIQVTSGGKGSADPLADPATVAIPVILMSSGPQRTAKEAGADEFLAKPLDLTTVEALIDRWVGRE